MQAQRIGSISKPAALFGVLGLGLLWLLSSGVSAGQTPGPAADSLAAIVPEAEETSPGEDPRAAGIRALLEGELDPSIDPGSLFDVALADESAIAIERARLGSIVEAAAPVAEPAASKRDPKTRSAPPRVQPGSLEIDAGEWQRRLDLDRARLAFLSLPRPRRDALLQSHADRQEAAIPRESEQARRIREAEEERRRALEAARIARTEAERLVREEEARLIALGERVERFVADLDEGRAELAERRDLVLGWQRRAREAGAGTHAVADETYDALRHALRSARDDFDAALASLRSSDSAVPTLGEDALSAVPDDIDTRHVRERRMALAGEIAAAQGAERAFRAARAEALMFEIDALNRERLALLSGLSPARRSAIVGFTSAGFDQARSELRHLTLVLRYHEHALRSWVAGLRDGGPSVSNVWDMARVLVPWTIFAAVFLSLRRRTPALVRAAEIRLVDADRAARRTFPSPQTRAMRVLGRVHVSIEWIVFLAGTLWLLPAAAFELIEVRIATSIAGWVLGGRLVVGALNAIAAVSGTTAVFEDKAIADLRLRSLGLVGKTIVIFALVLVLSDRLVGRGTIYSWAFSLLWFAAIPVFLVLIRWWRGAIFSRIDRVRRKSKLEAWVVANREGWQSFLAAMVGGVHLVLTQVRKVVGRWMSGFEVARRVHAYLFQLEIERKGDASRASALRPLDPGTLDLLHPERSHERWLASPADEVLKSLSARIDAKRGGVVALVGHRGMGKSAILREAKSRIAGSVTFTCLPDTTLSAVRAVLAREDRRDTENPGAPDGSDAADVSGSLPPLVMFDDAHALVRLVIGGLRVFDELGMFARANDERTLWAFAIDASVWPYLERSRDSRPLFDEVFELEAWNEAQIGALLRQRCRRAEIEPVFDDLIDRLPLGADELDRYDAVQAKKAGYERMLWDHSGGNPGIALEVWRSSLAQDAAGSIRVRSLQVPDASLLESLPDAALFVLRAIVQSTPATTDDLARTTRLPAADVLDMIRFGEGKGLFVSENDRIRVAWSWLRPVMRLLERRRLMRAQ